MSVAHSAKRSRGCGRKVVARMAFSQILQGLDDLDAHGDLAREAARMGFLEWVLTLEDGTCAVQAARLVLDDFAQEPPGSPAARAFLGYVGQAAAAAVSGSVRRGGRRRVLN